MLPRTEFWLTDSTTPGEGQVYTVSQILVWKQTQFQDVAIIDTPAFGKALILDGNWQSCVSDEFLYHEPLVHPAMLFHGRPRTVAILGGAEGATLREVLRWHSVNGVVMVDLDGEVVEACKENLPEMHRGAFTDLRTEVVIGDARDWLESTDEQFDVLISDLSEPLEHGPALELFTLEYFQKVRRVLNPKGFFALQGGSVAPHDIRLFARVTNTVARVFENVRPYASAVPSFGTNWGFILASSAPLDPLPSSDHVERLLEHDVEGTLRMLNGPAFQGLFQVSSHIQRAVETETEVFTLADPPQR
ncbi:MAG: methyltransferase domain-containing protein [Gemmatimonadota bacterium]|nr:MAG: methyltransferase domain-containing protein [Gemmatimonadota bacterium]